MRSARPFRSPSPGLPWLNLLLAALAIGPAAAGATGPTPRTVSPGGLSQSADAASPCPTFSWAGAPGAAGYELAVLALAEGAEPAIVVRETIEGSALSWSPDRSRCLGPGEYAWTVRALGAGEDEAPWAPVRRFGVAAAPSPAELAAALETLRRWQASESGAARNSPGTFPGSPGDSPGTLQGREAPEVVQVAGTAAIRGEMPGGSGETYGVLGLSASPQGAGLAAVNSGGGADLVLDGAAQGATDTRLFQDALDRPSPGSETFDFRNSGGGTMTLSVDGVDVVTTATDQDTLGGLTCANGQLPKQAAGGWTCGDDLDTVGGLACGVGQIAEVGPGGTWQCAPDDDALAALACPDGQIAKRLAGAWACAPDDTGTAGIWSTYPEGSDTRVVNQQGNRVAVGNRAIQPAGSYPTGDGALTVSHREPLPLTAQYNLTMDGRAIQARLAPDMVSPQQDAPLLLNPYGGGVAIGKGTPPTRAGLEVHGSVGHTMATFQRAPGGQGVALVGDWPGLYANAYFDNGPKTMAGSGYSQIINFDQTDGAMSFMTSTSANAAADVPAATLEERLRLRKDGALLSSLTQNRFNLAPLAEITLIVALNDDGSGGLTFDEIHRTIRSAYPISISFDGPSHVYARVNIDFDLDPGMAPLPVLGANMLDDWPPNWQGLTRNTLYGDVSVHIRDDFNLVGGIWNLQILIYGYN